MTDAPTPIEDLLVTLGLAHGSRPVHLTPGEAGSLLARPAFHGLTALLGAAVDTGDVRVDIATSGEVTRGWAEAMARAVELDGLLLEVCAALAQAGIPTRVLKGAAVATLDEPDPAWRSYQDVDVLVPTNRLMAAADALAPLGLQPAVPPVRRGWADRHAKSLTLRHHSGMQVDLHRRLAGGPLGARIRTDALFAGGDDLPVGTATLTALVAEHRFLHACYHAVLGGTRGPRHRRDVLLLARRVSPEAVEHRWDEGWVSGVVAAALRWATADGATAALPPAWTAWCERHDADSAGADATPGFQAQARGELRLQRGLRAKWAYVWPLVWPSRAHLQARRRTRTSHLRRLARTALARRSP